MLHTAEGEGEKKKHATIWRRIIKTLFYNDSSTQDMFGLMSMDICD
jgi:hypothetical protein